MISDLIYMVFDISYKLINLTFVIFLQERGVNQADLISFLLELSFHVAGEVAHMFSIFVLYYCLIVPFMQLVSITLAIDSCLAITYFIRNITFVFFIVALKFR